MQHKKYETKISNEIAQMSSLTRAYTRQGHIQDKGIYTTRAYTRQGHIHDKDIFHN